MVKLFRKAIRSQKKQERECGRKRFNKDLPTATCKTSRCAFIAPVEDISSNGAFVRTKRQFAVGQEVAMTINFPATGETCMVTGVIVRSSTRGVGVNFKVFFKNK
jgi:Tfp pilus assembly protein PilZ